MQRVSAMSKFYQAEKCGCGSENFTEDDFNRWRCNTCDSLAQFSETTKSFQQPVGITVDHRKIGCLIHDNINLAKQKHEIVLAIYDAIKPYLVKDSKHAD